MRERDKNATYGYTDNVNTDVFSLICLHFLLLVRIRNGMFSSTLKIFLIVHSIYTIHVFLEKATGTFPKARK